MKLFKQTPHFPFVKYRHGFLAASILIVAVSITAFATRGLSYGIDFLGGIKLQYQFPGAVTEDSVRDVLADLKLGDIEVIRYGVTTSNRLILKLANTSDAEKSGGVSKAITPKLIEKFGEGVTLEQEEIVGPKVGKELRRRGMLSVLFSLGCILIYIGFRFNFQVAPGAILALFHDVIVVLGLFAILHKEFNLTILAAVLTIVGYSINDTIIVFDRIREHTRLITPDTVEEIVNLGINETLARTVITSFTVFVVVFVMYLLGGATLKDFAFAMMIGVITGTYSTFSIAGPVYILLYRYSPQFEKWLQTKRA